MERLLALRAMEEERAEVEINRQRRLRQACLTELRASEERFAIASRAQYAALESGDRDATIAAEMALAFGPLERNVLQRELTRLDALVEQAANAHRTARIARMQIQKLRDAAEIRVRREMESREQKALGMWFLTSLIRRNADESFQRKPDSRAGIAGTVFAGMPGE
jgi:hypothetical protein